MKLKRLLSLAERYYEEFVEAKKDWENGKERVYAVERLAQLLAQAVLDFAAVRASRRPGRKPESYKELAKYLASEVGFESFLVSLAGFRNVLVHMYAEIDEELEKEAFEEIERTMPRVLERMKALAEDPCIEEVKDRLVEIARRWKVKYLVVIGSLAREGCGNDVDLAVRFGRKVSLLELGKFVADCEDLLKSKVDVVVLDWNVDPIMAKTVVDEAVLVWGDEEAFEDDLLKLYKKFLDEKRLVV